MKLIKSSVSILPQEPGVVGLFKHLEKVGRIAYSSQDKITDESYKKFNEMLFNRGHWAVFNSGTVYLKIPLTKEVEEDLIKLKNYKPYTRWIDVDNFCYLTTDYRVILKTKLSDFMIKYWSDPTDYHKLRITSHWICSRSTAFQLVRHRVMSFLMESQRYINYSREKFNGITFILPRWIYRVRENIGNTIDPLTKKDRKFILDLDEEELWNTLTTLDRTVASRDKFWKLCEEEYLYESTTDEGEKLKAEESRGCLCNDVKTELCMTGYLEDYLYEPSPDTPEKEGFFYLRCNKDAQEDIRILSEDLRKQFMDKGYL